MQALRQKLASLSTGRLALLVVLLLAVIGLAGFYTYRTLRGDQRLVQAKEALEKNQLAKARDLFSQILEDRPDDAEIHLYLARVARRADQVPLADKHLGQAEKIGGIPELVHLERMMLDFQNGKVQEASENALWNFVQSNHADRLTVLEALGKGYLKRFRLTIAAKCFQEILDSDPNHFLACLYLARAQEMLKNSADAHKNYLRAVELKPEHGQARLMLAKTLLNLKKPQEALEHLTLLQKHNPDAALVALLMGQAYIDLGQPAQARQILEQGRIRAEDSADSSFLWGRLHFAENHFDKAEQEFLRSLETGPMRHERIHRLLDCVRVANKQTEIERWEKKLKEVEEAVKRAETLIQEIGKTPPNLPARLELGQINLNVLKEEFEGLTWLHSVLEFDPRHAKTHAALAQHYRQKGQEALAHIHEKAAQK